MLATIDFFLGAAEPADSSIDWRHHEPPVLTPVKHQPGGTCWAFVATQQVESLAVIQLGKPLTELSTHQAWSCARAYNVTRGTPIECYLQNAWYLGPCYQDGWFCKCIPTGDSTDANPAVAWGYMQHVGGLATESDNPKDDSDKSCTVPTKPFVTVANLPKTRWGHTVIQPSTPCPWTFKLFYNYAQCHSNAEKQLRAAIQYSPVAISMSTHNIRKANRPSGDRSQRYPVRYILNQSDCVKQAPNHVLQLVGYDAPAQLWIVRNSWGDGWADNGFFYVQAGAPDCGLAQLTFNIKVENAQ